jgi:Spy/CpxP family protein refolding chaperone
MVRMWYALTAQTVKRSKKERNKEFPVHKEEIILSAASRAELEEKMEKTRQAYPEQMEKYLRAGVKIIEAKNAGEAKRRAHEVPVSIEKSGQFKLF